MPNGQIPPTPACRRPVLRTALTLLAILATAAWLAPAAALATGPSAGDQQYVDPLGPGHSSSGSHHSGSSHTSGSSTTSAPTPAPAPAPAATTSNSSSSTSAGTSTPLSTASTSASSAHAADPSGGQLPFTGFNVPLAAGLGLGMLGAGLYLRRRVYAA